MLCGWQSGQVRGAACSRPVPYPLPHCATAGQSAVTHPGGLVRVRLSADAARVYTERTLWVTVLKSRDGTLAGAPGQQRSDGSRNGGEAPADTARTAVGPSTRLSRVRHPPTPSQGCCLCRGCRGRGGPGLGVVTFSPGHRGNRPRRLGPLACCGHFSEPLRCLPMAGRW